jgi:hypothetical protein
MCFVDDAQTLIKRLDSLKHQLGRAQLICEGEDPATILKEMGPDLLYVTQCLLGVVNLKEGKTPLGDSMPVVDSVDEDALFHAFL